MIYLIYENKSGSIEGHSDGNERPADVDGYTWLEVDGGYDLNLYYVEDGALELRVPYVSGVADAFVLDGAATLVSDWQPTKEAGTYIYPVVGKYVGNITVTNRDLETEKAAKHEQVDVVRDAIFLRGVNTSGGVIQADTESRSNINGAVSMALIAQSAGQSFSEKWRLQDNSYVSLDAASMIQTGLVVGKFVGRVYQRSFELKDAITNALTLDELDAIDIKGGYPD